jgi:chemotaxis protein MotB
MDPGYQYVRISLSGSILFDSGKADIKPDAVMIFSKLGDLLQVYKDYHIEIEGHTDNVPVNRNNTYKDNNWLSSARALNVAAYLIEKKGLNPKTLSWTGRGEYDPVASNATPEGRAKNRRVEIKIHNNINN